MNKDTNDLQQLKGIGTVLAKRLEAAGLADYERIVNAGVDGLSAIPGIKEREIPSILAEAQQLLENKQRVREERIAGIRVRAGMAREKANSLVEATRQRLGEKISEKGNRRLDGDLCGVAKLLDRLDNDPLKRLKRIERGLDKVEKRMDQLTESGFKKVHKGLKKSKRALLNALA